MICSRCGSENRPGRRFCGACAAPLAVACPACAATNEPSARFCGECAAPLDAAAPAPPAARPAATGAGDAPVAERRVVSVLFADLVGFTPYAEGLDPEDVRDTLARYFDLAGQVIGRYGGTVEKFIGDAVMAVWGAPTAREDDAERAVRAALELVDAVHVLGPDINVRAGVLTGEAAVTLGATNQGMLAGDLVNTASRLESAAAPGTVLVGEATQRSAGRAIAFEPAGEQTLKGRAAPVPAWRALRVVAEVGGRHRRETFEAPFVGRADELRLLKELFHATDRERRARLVSVIGPAGIGKTRLAWEFLKYVDGLVDTVWWHDGRSPAYGEGISFWALGEMVRARAGLLETADEATTRARVAEMVATLIPDEAERRWIEPALLALLGVEARVGADHLFGAWRTFFERLAASAPVVMVFEDFHSADPGLLAFVDHLLEWSRNVPIYVLTLARPELLERRPTWGAATRSFTSIHLEPLPEPAMRELLAGLVPGLPPPAVRAIVARAEGVPLYAVETVRMLLAEGRLAIDGSVHVPVGDLATLAVPETLSALIASRLDGLDPASKALVSDAAVLGQSFTPAALSAVSGIDEADVEPLLRGLVRREILAVEADPRSPERGQYAFVQALIREVAYNTLARADRRRRHLAAARFFETLGSDELAGALAGHYLAAYATLADGPERDALAGQARIALSAAADRAAALGAHEQAAAFCEHALTVTSDPADRAALEQRAGEEASAGGRHEAAHRHLTEAIAARRALGDRSAIAGAAAARGRALLSSHRTADALPLLASAVAEFSDLAGDPGFIALEGQLARAHFLADDLPRAIEVADRVLEAAERADLAPIVADTLVTKGTALALRGRTIEGLAVLRAGRDLAETKGFGLTLVRAHVNRTSIQGIGDPRAGLEVGRVGLALARQLGYRRAASILFVNAAEDALRTGDWAWALDELEATLADELEGLDPGMPLQISTSLRALRGEPVDDPLAELARVVGPSTEPNMLASLQIATAFAAFAEGRLADARAAWHKVATYSVGNYIDAMARSARAALWAGDPDGARQDLAALDASPSHGPATEADRTTIRAGIAALDGRGAEAAGRYRDALRAWRDLGLAWDEALCAIDIATLLRPTEPDLRAAVDAARPILVGLSAVPFVARLDAATARSSIEAAGRSS